MPDVLAKVPNWAWISLGVVALLLAPLALLGGGSPASGELPGLSNEQQQSQLRVESLINARRYDEATAQFRSIRDYPIAGVPTLVQSLWRQLRIEPTPKGLDLYARLLKRLVSEDHPFGDFPLHLRRLRQLALVWGGTDLLDKLMSPIFGRPGFYQYSKECHFDQIHHGLLFERWDEALATYKKRRLTAFREPGDVIEKRYRRLRSLIRLATAGQSQLARDWVRHIDEQLGGFLAGTAPDAEPRFRSWLRGVERLFAADSKLNRGSRALNDAVDRRSLGPSQVMYRIDYAQALHEEALLREARVQLEQLPLSGSSVDGADPNFTRQRARHLFVIGWGVARLGDISELRHVISTLRQMGKQPLAAGYSALLSGLREILEGNESSGRDRIRHTLESTSNPFSSAQRSDEAEVFARIAAGSDIPEGDTGRILFENGKRWGEFPDQGKRVSRTVERLRTRIASSRDSAYLNYLEALDSFRNNRLSNAREKLLHLLEVGPPPGLSREEIAWLLVFAEEQEKDLADIAARRRQALEVLDEVIGINSMGSTEPLVARMLTLQIRLLSDGAGALDSEEGAKLFDEIVEGVEQPWLPFPAIEGWLALKEQLFTQAKQQALAGEFDAAGRTLIALRRLGRDLPKYFQVEGAVHRGLALQTEREYPDNIERHKELWQLSGEAFWAAANTEFGDPEYFFDAGVAFWQCGDTEQAETAFNAYIPRRVHGADEQRYWQSLLYKARIMRSQKNYRGVAELVAARLNDEGLGTQEFELILEQARCYESLGKTEEALRDYDYIYTRMESPNDSWYEAIYRKARIVQAAADRASARGSDAAQSHIDALRAWEEVATRLKGKPHDARRAEALFHAGEAEMVLGNPSGGLILFEQLQQGAAAIKNERLPAADVRTWNLYAEKGVFALGDAHFQVKNFSAAEAVYDRSVGVYSNSSLVPWGYHQLAECAARQGRKAEALRLYALATRIVSDLPAEVFAELPLNRGRDFWLKSYAEKSRLVEKSKE